MPRTLIWWSTGAASAVMARLMLRENPDAIIVRCETGNEDPDNYRFEADVMRRLNRSVELLQSDEYENVWDVWQKRRYMSGNNGAPCTSAMKIAPRLAFQKPTDIHAFGYTADAEDVERYKRLKANYPELNVRAPLIDFGITKAGSMAMVEHWGIELPRSYAMGFPNANCLQTGCVKATSPDYWSLYRHSFPDNFARTAAYAREIGCRLTRINDVRIFIDEIPADWPMTNPIVLAMKTTPVRKLQDEYLLNEFEGFARWAGDDFAIHQITHNALRRKDAARKEILRRMALSQQIRTET